MTSKLTRERLEELAAGQSGFNLRIATHEESQELARMALAAMDSEPVAWDYEWASCITCEGPQNFNRVIEREAPPEWSIEEGQAKNIIPLYRHAQQPVVQPMMFIDGDISSEDADKLAKVIREFNEEDERPLAKMARIIRENPHPTNECDMPKSQPAPVVPVVPVVPEGLRLALSNAGIAAPESDEMLAATHEKYVQMLVGWVKDRKPAPVVYSDFENFWSTYIHPLAQDDELKDFAWDIWKACRAAMLQAGRLPHCE